MEKVREVVSAALSLRKAEQIRVRQPLARMTVVTENPDAVRAYEDILKSELNIKAVELCTLDEAAEHGLRIINELRRQRPRGRQASAQGRPVRHQVLQVRCLHVDAAGARGGGDPVRRDRAGGGRVRADQPRGGGEPVRCRQHRVRGAADRRLRDPRHHAG